MLIYVFLFFIFLMFIRISVIDWREHAIYDKDIVLTMVFVALYKVFYGDFLSSLYGLATSLIVGLLIFGVVYKVYGFEAFGQGDVILLAALGFFLDTSFLHYFAFAMMLGGILGVLMLLLSRKHAEDIELAYAPVLLVWLPLYFYFNKPSLWAIYNLLFS